MVNNSLLFTGIILFLGSFILLCTYWYIFYVNKNNPYSIRPRKWLKDILLIFISILLAFSISILLSKSYYFNQDVLLFLSAGFSALFSYLFYRYSDFIERLTKAELEAIEKGE